MKLPGHGRYAHSAIPDRPSYEWPNGTRLALLLCNNIEFFAYRAGLGSDSTGIAAMQNQRSDAWRDYGNRVGLWNMLDMLDELELPCAHNVNGAVLDACPEIAPALKARGDEFIGHGRSNSERQDGMWEEDERRLIAESREPPSSAMRRRAAGLARPLYAQSAATLDLLKEEGFGYVMEWPADAQPFWMATRAGPILSVPYSVELNDSPALVVRQHSGRQFAEMIVDQFDEMLEQSRKRPLVCSVVLHPFIVGQPFRLRALRGALRHILSHRDRLWVTRPGELARYVATLPRASCPARTRCHDDEEAGRARYFAGYGRTPPDPALAGRGACRVQLRHQLRGGRRTCRAGWRPDQRDGGGPKAAPRPSRARDWPRNRCSPMAAGRFWRLHRIFTKRGLPCTVFAVARALERNPEACAAMREAGWDVAGHGLRWEMHHAFDEATERRRIAEATALIARCIGERPAGWYTRYAPSMHTRRLLLEAGYDYDSDAYDDEIPYWVKCAGPRRACGALFPGAQRRALPSARR